MPGFIHDPCSTVHPLGKSSRFFRSLGLERYGLRWIDPEACVAHLLRDGEPVLMEHSLSATAMNLGRDGPAYTELLQPFVERFDALAPMLLGPVRWPSHPALYARFGLAALPSLKHLSKLRFQGEAAPALLAGIAAHAMLPLDRVATASFALVLGAAAHAVGWPIAEGGSQAIARALVACLEELGGELRLGVPISDHRELPPARAYLFDVTPRQLLAIYGDAMPARYARRLQQFRYGPGVFKIDWALDAPIPWRDPRCALVIDEQPLPYRKVSIDGVAELVHDLGQDDAWRDRYRRIARRYVGADAAGAYIQTTIDQPRALFRVPLAGSSVSIAWIDAAVRSAPSRSALFTTKMSAISMMPALSACTSSPVPGTTVTTDTSAVRTMSTSS